MAVDAELISSEGFNLKFKNYLRDFFIYQFKERGSDFKVKGTNDKSNVNKDIIASTFQPDAKRLQYALEQSAGVYWSKGDFADLPKGCKSKKNKRVECITADSRRIERNPFFSLYQLCSESTLTLGTHFSFIYTLLMYFHLGGKTGIADSAPLTSEDYAKLNAFLKRWTVDLLSAERKNSKEIKWEEVSVEQKQEYAEKVMKAYHTDHTQYDRTLGDGSLDKDLEKIYNYILRNKKKLIFQEGEFQLANDESKTIEKNTLFKIMQMYGIEVDIKQFGNKMQELTRLGIVRREKQGQRISYALSDTFLSDLIGKDEEFRVRFSDCVSFFSEISALGEIGAYILNRLPKTNNNYIKFKHNYINHALNDYNNIDLLYAIQNNLWAVIEYRNAALNDLEYQKIVCYPIEIRENVTDGRQYLIYYYPVFRSISAVRIDFIDSIVLGNRYAEEHFNEDLRRARNLMEHTWGTAFDHFREGNVKKPFEPNRVRVLVSYDENEAFIKARLYREVRKCASFKEFETDAFGHCLEVAAEVVNPQEMLRWLRSYITRVVTVEINGKVFSEFTDDVIKTYESYVNPTLKSTENVSSRTGKSLLRDEVPADFVPVDNMHSRLFNEIYGVSFLELGNILLDIMRTGKISDDFKTDLQEKYARNFTAVENADKRKEQAYNFMYAFVKDCGNQSNSVFTLLDDTISQPTDFLPLTALERQWLANILHHPLAKCFLSESEISKILDELGNVELFDVNAVVLHDQYIGAEEFYRGTDFSASIQKIMKAIRDNRMVTMHYKSQYGRQSNYVCAPVYMEYSKRDNRIRIRAVSKSNVAKTFNLERIQDVVILNDTYDKKAAEEAIEKHLRENECELVLFFNETKNVPDRILTEFSCYKKKCVKWGAERYRMILYYDKDDRLEILVRLLSYGSSIRLLDDTGDVYRTLIERLKHQLALTNSKDLIFAVEPKEKE